MVPPLAMALASTLRPRLFTEPERENGRAAWLLGACFITEGAIPFAAADPLRVIPSMMAGGAVTGALVMAANSAKRARNPRMLPVVPADRETIFTTPHEFLDYHNNARVKSWKP